MNGQTMKWIVRWIDEISGENEIIRDNQSK